MFSLQNIHARLPPQDSTAMEQGYAIYAPFSHHHHLCRLQSNFAAKIFGVQNGPLEECKVYTPKVRTTLRERGKKSKLDGEREPLPLTWLRTAFLMLSRFQKQLYISCMKKQLHFLGYYISNCTGARNFWNYLSHNTSNMEVYWCVMTTVFPKSREGEGFYFWMGKK